MAKPENNPDLKKNITVSRVVYYRSKPLVNMADDRVAVTLTMPKWIWPRFRRLFDPD